MAGRKPTPSALKELRGNPGKRAIPKSIPAPESILLPAPAFLDAESKAEWDRVMPMLVRWGLFTPMDLGTLAGYCVMHEVFVACKTAIDNLGGVTYETQGKTGPMQRIRPEFVVMVEALKQMRALGSEFGLTPSARDRLKGAAQGDLFADLPETEPERKTASPWDALDSIN